MFLGEAIRARREALLLSQEDLARHSDVSASALGRIERGDTVPRQSTLRRIAISLQLDQDHFETIRKDDRRTQVIEWQRRQRRNRCPA